MIVRVKTILAGPFGAASPGESVRVDDKTGQSLIDGGFAVLVEATRIESASISPPENAQMATAKPKRGRK